MAAMYPIAADITRLAAMSAFYFPAIQMDSSRQQSPIFQGDADRLKGNTGSVEELVWRAKCSGRMMIYK